MGNETTKLDNCSMLEWFITDARQLRLQGVAPNAFLTSSVSTLSAVGGRRAFARLEFRPHDKASRFSVAGRGPAP